MMSVLVLMIFAHYLCDYPLQGDFLARAKNQTAPIPGVPWWQAMTAHAAIHAGAVYIITGWWVLFVLEFIAHFIIDRAKCRGLINYNIDQVSHLICKVIWIIALAMVQLK